MKPVSNAHGAPLRVCMISEHASPLAALGGTDSGGQNVYVAQLARHLARRGHHVDVFTRRDGTELPEVAHVCPGVRVIHVPAGPPAFVRKEDLLPYMPAFAEYVEGWVRREGYDLAHANFFMSGVVASILRARTGLPYAVTFHALGKVRLVHQGAADGFPAERLDIEERLAREADAVIAECPQDCRDLVDLHGADPARVTVVPCGFDRAEFWPVDRAEARAALGLDAGGPVILQLGRMVPRKGVDNVIRAVGRLRAGGLDARLLVVGGEARTPDPALTPELGRLASVAEEEGVRDLVTFVGSRGREELRAFYAAADVFVSTPWYEPFGITPVEAMACGTPVIGSRVGGIQHTVAHGRTGFLVPPRDPEALAARLRDLLVNPALRARMSASAVRRANEHFTWEKVADAAEGVFARVRDERGAVRASFDLVDRAFDDAVQALQLARTRLRPDIVRVADLIARTFERGGKVLVCGNGGSAADAQHFAAELVGRFRRGGRRGLPVISMTADTAVLTAWANDIGYDDVFARQVEAFGTPGDLLLGISTSGRSANVNAALRAARERGVTSVALLGGSGGEALTLADESVVVPSHDTPRVQEVQILVLHLLCELVENAVHDAPTLATPVGVAGPPRAAGILAGTPLGTD